MRPRAPRVEGAFRVRYRTMDELVVAYSKNLSKGGLFLRTDKCLPVNAPVRLHVALPDGGGELTIECRVAYVAEPTDWDAIRQVAGMGIEFVDPRMEASTEFDLIA